MMMKSKENTIRTNVNNGSIKNISIRKSVHKPKIATKI